MTVSRAFALAFGVLAVAVLLAQSLLLVHLERGQALEQRRAAHRVMGQTLAGALGSTWARSGPEEAQRTLNRPTEVKEVVSLRWVWLDAERVTPRQAPVAEAAGIPRDHFSASILELQGERSLVSYTPTRVDANLGAVEITERLADEAKQRRDFAALLFANTVIVLALFAVVGGALGRRLVARPVGALADMARRVGAGELSGRVQLHTRTEFDELAQAMKAMAGSLEQQTRERDAAIVQVRHSDRLATVGKLAAGVAHELGTPLNVVQGRARMLQSGDLEPSDAVRAASEIIGETERMTALVKQLLDFAGKRGGERTRVDLHDVVAHALSLLTSTAAKRGITLESQLAPAPVTAAAGQLQQVVTNLVLNAIQASAAGTTISVEVRRSPREVTLSVRDHGAGIPPEVQSHLFEPFFTTRPAGEGTGLGLAVSYGIVQDLGGRISASNAEGGGARFEVALPAAGQEIA